MTDSGSFDAGDAAALADLDALLARVDAACAAAGVAGSGLSAGHFTTNRVVNAAATWQAIVAAYQRAWDASANRPGTRQAQPAAGDAFAGALFQNLWTQLGSLDFTPYDAFTFDPSRISTGYTVLDAARLSDVGSAEGWRSIVSLYRLPPTGKWGFRATLNASYGSRTLGGAWSACGVVPGSLFDPACAGGTARDYWTQVTDSGWLRSGTAAVDLGLGLAAGDVLEFLADMPGASLRIKRNGTLLRTESLAYLSSAQLAELYVAATAYRPLPYRFILDAGQNGYTPSESGYRTLI